MNESINIDKKVLKILQETGTEKSLLEDITKINSNKYTMMYTTHDHEVCYHQVDSLEQINQHLKSNTEDHESGWELEYIFHSGKKLNYKTHTTVSIEFVPETTIKG